MTKDQIEKRYIPVLKRYKEMFGYVPNPEDYIYLSMDQFYTMLIKSLQTRKELSKYLICKKNFIA